MSEPVRLPVPAPARISQGTAVEQSRAAAEVLAAMQAARLFPRDEQQAAQRMREVCARFDFADRAFYSVPRGGKTVRNPSVHLARELARLWGNMHYGAVELDRDPVGPDRDRGRSEIMVYAWDLESNLRPSSTFIVEHARDLSAKGDKPATVDQLTTLQSVYEMNANNQARRLREALFAVLPVWYRDEAIELCRATLRKGDGRPLSERIPAMVDAFAAIGVRLDRLERRVGKPRGRWVDWDLADLRIIGESIKRGDSTIDDEFPMQVVQPDELPAGAGAEPAAQPVEKVEPRPDDAPGLADREEDSPWSMLDRLGVAPSRKDDALAGLLGTPVKSYRQLGVRQRDFLRRGLQTILDEPDEATRQGDVRQLLDQGAAVNAQNTAPADEADSTRRD